MKSARLWQLLLLVSLLFAVGCSSNNEGKIEGTKWTSNAAKVQGQTIPEGLITLEFRKNGDVIYIAGPETFLGKYSLGWGDYVTFNFNQEISGHKKHLESIAIKGNQLTMTDTDGTSLSFTKLWQH